jgi:hypothetical protein
LTAKALAAVALSVLSAVGLIACGGTAESDDRGTAAVGICRGHDGAIALEDEFVICRDQTAHDLAAGSDDRGTAAVGICRGHGGAIALEDQFVICRDQTAHELSE